MRWREPTELDPTGKPILREKDWDDAAGKVKGRLDGAVDKFDQSLAKEKSRAQDLDDLFLKAKEKADKRRQSDELP